MVHKKKIDEVYCFSCGNVIKKEAEICPKCGVRQKNHKTFERGDKDRIAAGLLGIFLGIFGVHKFYLGKVGMGVLYLCFFWTIIPAIVGFIEGIIYLTMTDEEFKAKYG